MRTSLVFSSEGILREGERDLGHIELVVANAYAAVVIGEHRFDIARHGRTGWHFALLDTDGVGELCRFRAARLGRGGLLMGASMAVKPRGLFASKDWRITHRDRAPVEVRVRPGAIRDEDGRRRVMVGSGIAPELAVRLAEPLSAERMSLPLLIFACWLIVEWESVPKGDASGSMTSMPY
jgi:hypothetical protein